jgi:hypothetical protein
MTFNKDYIIVIRQWVGQPGFDSWQELGIFLFVTTSRPALGLTQPPIQWVTWTLSLGVKQAGCEADHSPPCSNKVKNVCSCTSTHPYIFIVWFLSTGYIFMAWYLVKPKDFTSTCVILG